MSKKLKKISEKLIHSKKKLENSRILQKSKFDISPNLMFSSPERIKNEIEKYKNKRNKSSVSGSRPLSHNVTHRSNNKSNGKSS